MTTKLYQEDVYIKEWDAKIVSIEPVDDALYDVILDRSAFFPEGGGQSCDLGTIGSLTVIDVQEKDDEVVHRVKTGSEGDPSGDTTIPATSNSVHCALDWDRRFDNMQRHCGEHILSGIFYARCGGVNRGFHMGTDYMTIDISLEDDPSDEDAVRPEAIDMNIALACERRANQVIWSNAPVTVFRYDDRDQVADMPLRKALAFDEDISIVCVGDVENAADCVACCGTHPSSAGQVGLIKIYKVENYKGMFRVYFEAGARALADYDRKHEILTDLAEDHSSSVEELPGAIRAQEEKISTIKNELYHTKKILIAKEQDSINSRILAAEKGEELSEASTPSITWESLSNRVPLLIPVEDLSMDDVFEISKSAMGKTPFLIMFYVARQTSFILASNGEPHCGNLVREYASFYKGKGGGSDTSARAIFSTEEDAMLFADLIRKHLS